MYVFRHSAYMYYEAFLMTFVWLQYRATTTLLILNGWIGKMHIHPIDMELKSYLNILEIFFYLMKMKVSNSCSVHSRWDDRTYLKLKVRKENKFRLMKVIKTKLSNLMLVKLSTDYDIYIYMMWKSNEQKDKSKVRLWIFVS